MPIVNESGTAPVAPVQPVAIREADTREVYEWAMREARRRARGNSEVSDSLIDAATDAILWARERCADADKFPQFARAAIKKWMWRRIVKRREKAERRPQTEELPREVAATRPQSPTGPMLIEDLPEDLAFAVRLYMVDGYNLRDCGFLMGKSPNTVDLMLKKATELLAVGRLDKLEKPERRKGEKRLTAG